MAEEIKGITWDLDGAELTPVQAAQRLYLAGFKDAKVLATMWAVLEAESGGYLRAWHHNVERNEDGTIKRDEHDRFTIKSTDLGFIQRNVVHSTPVKMEFDAVKSQTFVDGLYASHPELASGHESAAIAFDLFSKRGYQPWYAYSNGSYRKNLERACAAVGNYLGMSLAGNRNLLQLKS